MQKVAARFFQAKEMITVIIPAGGIGKRFGGETPKQFVKVKGREIITYSINLFESMKEIRAIIVAVPPLYVKDFRKIIEKENWKKVETIKGGIERMDSVWNALNGVKTEYVLIHDAVRPLINKKLVRKVINGMLRYGACIPVLEISDTVKVSKGLYVVNTIPRTHLRLSQTPQGFKTSLLKESYKKAKKEKIFLTDDAMALEYAGHRVRIVKGDKKNIKITYREDIKLLECILK